MAGIASEVGKLLSVTGVWLIAIFVPIARSVQHWVNRRRDFDVVGSALVPSILFFVLLAVILGGILAPRGGGLEALWIWVGFRTELALEVVGWIAIAILVGAALLLFGGHRLLLGIWKIVPLPRESKHELPTVDRTGVVLAFEVLRSQIKRAKPVTPGKEPGTVHQFLLTLLRRQLVPASFDKDPEKLRAVTTLNDRFAMIVAACRNQANRIVDAANGLAQGDIPPVSAADDGGDDEASSKDPLKRAKKAENAPNAEAVQHLVEDLLDGLSPRFVAKHQALAVKVADFQEIVCSALRVVGQQIESGTVAFNSLSDVSKLVDELDEVSRDLAWRLSQAFGVDDAHRIHANSLAFNLDSTTLGRWRYWRPLERYDWARGKEFEPSDLVDKANEDERITKRLQKAVKEVAEPQVRTLPKRTQQWPAFARTVDLIERNLATFEQAERAKRRAKAALKEHLSELQKKADELELLRAARSKIVTYTTLASVIVVIGVLVATLALGIMRTSQADAAILSVIVAWFGLALAMYVAVRVFIYPVANHAFLLCMIENRKRLEAGGLGSSRPRPSHFDWSEPVRPGRRVAASMLIAIGVALLPMLAHAVLVDAGVTDYRLVVKSTRSLGKDDGVTARNLRDLVEVSWKRCNPSWPENRLIDPSELVDTYLVEDCPNDSSVFIKPDLVVRAGAAARNGVNPVVGPSKGCFDRFLDRYELISEHVQAPKEAICRSSINKPKEPAAITPPPTTDTPIAITIPNVTTVAVNTGSIVMPPVEVRVPPPTVIQVGSVPSPEPPPVYVVFPDRPESPRPAQHIGNVKFNFDCSQLDAIDHCIKGQPPTCPLGDPVDAASNRKELDKIVEQIRKVGPKKNIVFVGWADSTGGVTYNKRLGGERASDAVKKVSEALKKVQVAANGAQPSPAFEDLSHVLGVGAGNPPGSECNANRRRVDVYVISAD
jgi:hypothetical protein